jgi:Cu/Ag efflux protein CusF
MKFKSVFSVAVLAGACSLVQAQTTNASAAMPADSGSAQASATAMTNGEVRKVDKESKKITLKHGEIKNLGMPGMTMVFHVKDPAMLDMVKQGDKVQFKADKANGALIVTEMQLAK